MKIKLYDCFSHWKAKGNIWLYSDPHFGDLQVKDFRNNNVSDEEQVKRINSKVGKNDILIILGDIGDISYVSKLKGYKILVKGNHDSGVSNYEKKDIIVSNYKTQLEAIQAKERGDIEDWYCTGGKSWFYTYVGYKNNHLFDEVYEGPIFINNKILLSHEPIGLPFVLNIHGHDHSHSFYKDDNHINVCAEHIMYTPISLRTIIDTGVLKNIPDIHRLTADKASKNKKENTNA